MKKLVILVAFLFCGLLASSQNYITIDTLNTNPLVLKGYKWGNYHYYRTDINGVTLFTQIDVAVVINGNVTIFYQGEEEKYFQKTQFPTLYNYLTSATVQNGFKQALEATFD